MGRHHVVRSGAPHAAALTRASESVPTVQIHVTVSLSEKPAKIVFGSRAGSSHVEILEHCIILRTGVFRRGNIVIAEYFAHENGVFSRSMTDIIPPVFSGENDVWRI